VNTRRRGFDREWWGFEHNTGAWIATNDRDLTTNVEEVEGRNEVGGRKRGGGAGQDGRGGAGQEGGGGAGTRKSGAGTRRRRVDMTTTRRAETTTTEEVRNDDNEEGKTTTTRVETSRRRRAEMSRRGGNNAPQWDEAGVVGMGCTAGDGTNAAGIPALPLPLSRLQIKIARLPQYNVCRLKVFIVSDWMNVMKE
jgi:hypothetical protein